LDRGFYIIITPPGEPNIFEELVISNTTDPIPFGEEYYYFIGY